MNGLTNLVLAGMLAVVPSLSVENTHILGYGDQHHTVDYNRLRTDLSLQHDRFPDLVGRVMIDNETSYTTRPRRLNNQTSIHRAYLQYRGEKHFWAVGKQRIPLGVGRIWNPIDVFNPVDAEAIEINERVGTESLRYEYALGRLANIDTTVARDRVAARLKGYLEYADVGLVYFRDADRRLDVIGWELEGQLLKTGIELRSEGGRFHNRRSGNCHTEFIIGAEYGFTNSLTLLGEYRYSGDTGSDHVGLRTSYQPAMLWSLGLLVLENLDDRSGFISPSVEYSLSDDMTLGMGAFCYYGSRDDEFGTAPNRYYIRWFVHF